MPLVTAVCPTRNRREWLPRALECFYLQTYANRELVIIADEKSDIEGLIPAWALQTNVRAFVTNGHLSIGSKRNYGAAQARGEVILHWDDDDWSGPLRIEDQVQRLLATGKQVTGYRSMRFRDGHRWFAYCGDLYFALDTSLCYRKEFWERHLFDEINDGLEFRFRAAAIEEGVFIAADAGELMYATVHPKNTSPHNIDTVNSASWREVEAK